MTEFERIRSAIDHTLGLGAEDAPDFDELFEDVAADDDETLARLVVAVDEYRRVTNLIKTIIDNALEALLAEREADPDGAKRSIMVGETLVWRGESSTEKIIDTEGFWAWLASQDFEMVKRLFNPNSARKGSLPPAARSTFFDKTPTGKIELQRAPVQVLEDARQKKKLAGDGS